MDKSGFDFISALSKDTEYTLEETKWICSMDPDHCRRDRDRGCEGCPDSLWALLINDIWYPASGFTRVLESKGMVVINPHSDLPRFLDNFLQATGMIETSKKLAAAFGNKTSVPYEKFMETVDGIAKEVYPNKDESYNGLMAAIVEAFGSDWPNNQLLQPSESDKH